uniref:DOG1 domain-containing protein n=1 Tax=Oryza glumipatula TaxID=40148 RepID=A0A0E0BDW9_9ORYZ
MHRILTTRQVARALLVISDYFSRLRALSSLWLARPRDARHGMAERASHRPRPRRHGQEEPPEPSPSPQDPTNLPVDPVLCRDGSIRRSPPPYCCI